MTYYIRPYRRMWRHIEAAQQANAYALPVDIRDDGESFTLTAVVPGLTAEDLNIQVLEDVLRIEGEYQTSDGEHLLRELPAGKFIRTLRLPSELDPNKAEARIKDGILTLSLPKAESAKPKTIKVAVK
ncbi:MAG: Hsp20/alpha crystallin family protein [Chloroflexota bacterium]